MKLQVEDMVEIVHQELRLVVVQNEEVPGKNNWE